MFNSKCPQLTLADRKREMLVLIPPSTRNTAAANAGSESYANDSDTPGGTIAIDMII